MNRNDKRHAIELARHLERAAETGGAELGIIDSEVCVKALRYATRRRRFPSLSVIAMTVLAIPAIAFADFDRNGKVTIADLHGAIDFVADRGSSAIVTPDAATESEVVDAEPIHIQGAANETCALQGADQAKTF